ncbi:STAS-like domain-containing protein [Achromobacter xylosoxidans]
MKTIEVAQQFSRYPGGRFFEDGPYSGQAFRERFLLPPLARGEEVKVVLDGARGYGSSFLEEAFGGLVRAGLTKPDLRRLLTIESHEDESLVLEVADYIAKALPQ